MWTNSTKEVLVLAFITDFKLLFLSMFCAESLMCLFFFFFLAKDVGVAV